ncbi:hypothetical protein KUM42_08280 [Modestobacter sp. L9-4]|uniref:hypothetical protein n=1 Tax=Modestobacter sp. L9-4 TaxID=2851567 RepID=UPI001C7563B4|nr:hypothetical protein [Modestobacter sp. L9-4]QXG77487.1 hypothetical protein KUM42_08280 [Modestobacter sp. L9-4]
MIIYEAQHESEPAPKGGVAAGQRYTTRIYDMPVVGKPLRQVRELADSLRPTDEDTWGVRAGKNLARGSIVAGTTGVVMIAVL